MAAAVADYRPARRSRRSARRTASGWTVELEPTTDVLAALGERRAPGPGARRLRRRAGRARLERKRAMLTRKNVDLVVYNDVGRADIGFESADNEVTLIDGSGERTVAKAPKDAIAAAILDEVERLLG